MTSLSVRAVKAFDGPNAWCRRPVCWAVMEDRSERPITSERISELHATSAGLISAIVDPTFSTRPLGPGAERRPETTGELVAELALLLQRQAGVDVRFGASRPAGSRAFEIAVERQTGDVARNAIHLAIRILNESIAGAITFDLGFEFVTRVSGVAESNRQAVASDRLVVAARAQGIPVSRIDPRGRVIDLGTGVYRRRLFGSMTSLTPSLGDAISADKALMNAYLRSAGIPVPRGGLARTAEQAVAVAQEIGYPVVVKPIDGLGGGGVETNIRDDDGVRRQAARVLEASLRGVVLVERHLEGRNYRVTVLGDRVPIVTETLPARVAGDGRRTIRELIEVANLDPRRGRKEHDPLRTIKADDACERVLAKQGFALDSVPAAGEHVRVREFGLVWDGGITINRTAKVHPSNLDLFVQAAKVAGLELASMDVIAADIGVPMREGRDGILDINVGSGYRNEFYTVEGDNWDVGPPLLEKLLAPGAPARVPVIAVVGDGGADIGEGIAEAMTMRGMVVGLATGEQVRVGSTRLWPDPVRGGASTVLSNPHTEIAVVEVTAKGIIERGLAFAACDVAIVTGLSGLSRADGAPVERVLTDLVQASGVIVFYEDDPWVAAAVSAWGSIGAEIVAVRGDAALVAAATAWVGRSA